MFAYRVAIWAVDISWYFREILLSTVGPPSLCAILQPQLYKARVLLFFKLSGFLSNHMLPLGETLRSSRPN